MDRQQRRELLQLMEKVRQYPKPPDNKDDLYDEREPWNKLGGVSSGISMGWGWCADYAVLQYATKEDLMRAIKELEEFYGK